MVYFCTGFSCILNMPRMERIRREAKEEKTMEQKNWFNLTQSPALYCRYAYIDLEDHLADSLFERQNISVHFEQEFENPVNGYRLIVCRILPWYREGFLTALSQLPNKMKLLGFNDYQDFCREYLDYSESWMAEKTGRQKKAQGKDPCVCSVVC